AEGCRVLVNDIDAGAAEQVAREIGAEAVGCDAASEDGVAELVAAAGDLWGGVDVWFGNAGVERGRGLQASEADWAASLEVNLLAHVLGGRLLLPEWRERGIGRLVVRAPAAWPLTMMGSTSYCASKHAVVALAGSLSATYRPRVIVVQGVCRQVVRSRMVQQ